MPIAVDYDTHFKMKPPLRRTGGPGRPDGRARGRDWICDRTDHAPHTDTEKERHLRDAPFGVIGLETAFAVGHDRLVSRGPMYLWSGWSS